MLMSKTLEKPVARLVIEFSQRYIWLTLQGLEEKRTIDSERFRYPFDLESDHAEEEARDCFAMLYDYCNESLNDTEEEIPDDDKQ